MTYGPCGGVRPDLSCEMAPHPCVFAAAPVVAWAGAPVAPRDPVVITPGGTGPMILTDLTVMPYSPGNIAAVCAELAGSCDGVLVGEHQSRPDFPPTLMAALVRQAGLPPWITLTCRDRNRVVLEQELAGLAAAGAAGVLCVTGDGRAHGVRPEVTQVFDIDGTQLAALAAGTGLPVAVPESPGAPPRELRPGRLRQKQLAGADVAVLNHVGSPAAVAAFMAAARDEGLTMPVIAGVTVYTDERSARALDLPGLAVDHATRSAVLSAPDPVEAGIAAAVDEAVALLGIEGVAGVNLSGSASGRDQVFGASVKAAVGHRIRAERS
jgi:methylenetetrahydrofolate reductase (NADPH)